MRRSSFACCVAKRPRIMEATSPGSTAVAQKMMIEDKRIVSTTKPRRLRMKRSIRRPFCSSNDERPSLQTGQLVEGDVATHPVITFAFMPRRLLLATDVSNEPGAARMETAPGRDVHRTGHRPSETYRLLLDIEVGDWHGRHQRLRVGVERRAEHPHGIADLHYATEVHHCNSVREMLDGREIVRDEHVRRALLDLQLHQEVHERALDRDVERRDRFVAEDQIRVGRKSPGDGDALLLAPAELVRQPVEVTRGQAHRLQQVLGAIPRGLATHATQQRQRPENGVAHASHRIERGVRVLEHHLDLAQASCAAGPPSCPEGACRAGGPLRP